MITLHKKPLLEDISKYNIVLLPCNCYCMATDGFQKEVNICYPYAYEKDRDYRYADFSKLGNIVESEHIEGKPFFILCYITKGYGFRRDLNPDYLEYDALEECIKKINIQYHGATIASTLIGSNKFDGNGEKNKVMEILNNNTSKIDLHVYDYEQKTLIQSMNDFYHGVFKLNVKKYFLDKYNINI